MRRKTTLLKIGKNTKNKHHQRRYMHGKWPSETMLSFTVMENYKPRPWWSLITPTGIATFKKSSHTRCWQCCWVNETLYIAGENIKWNNFGKQFGSFSGNGTYIYRMNWESHSWTPIHEKYESLCPCKDSFTNVRSCFIWSSSKLKKPKSLSTDEWLNCGISIA